MRTSLTIKLLILFAVAASLSSLPGPLASFHLAPSLNLARASQAPAQAWTPAGPAMDTEKANIYTDIAPMLTGLSTGQIDLTDEPASTNYILCVQNADPTACAAIGITDPTKFYITSAISEHGVYEVQINLSNTFWGVPFNFGNDGGACNTGVVGYAAVLTDPVSQTPTQGSASCPGVSIRQGLAHLIDKVSSLSTITNCNGGTSCSAIDTDVPLGIGLVSPNVCGWDTLFSSSLNVAPCSVGTSNAGSEGNAYHFSTAAAGNCATTPLFAWEAGCGTPDFCAAADHFIAAGVASGKNPTTCVLTGISASALPGINVFTRSSEPRHDLGNSLADAICALFTGTFRAVGSNALCLDNATDQTGSATAYLTQETGTINQFNGFVTQAVGGQPPLRNWFIYTGAFIQVFPFDSLTYGVFNSSFSDNSGASTPTCTGSNGPAPNPVAPAVLTAAPSNYLYACNALYDQLSNAMEFSPAVAVGCPTNTNGATDPTAGQTTPTFCSVSGTVLTGNCALSLTVANNCTAVSAGYQTENLSGQLALDIPVFGLSDKDVYTSNFNNGVSNGVSAGIPNFQTFINAYTNTPAPSGSLLQNCPSTPAIIGPDCYRQGFSANTKSLNPFAASTFWDFNIIGNIYDSLGAPSPQNTNQIFSFMTIGAPARLANTALGYTPAAGTVTSLRYTLRPDVFFHNGQKVTSWDVKFSYLELKATGAFQSTGAAPVQDVHVLSPTIFDLNLNSIGPFTLQTIVAPTIMPGSLWTSSGSSAWNSAEATCSGTAVANPESCFTIADPTAYNVTRDKFSISYDPLASGTLIGSGAFECLNPTTLVVGGGCSNTGTENPTVNYQLTRFGAGTTPALASPSSRYFRSSGTMALYIWAGNNGGTTHDFLNISQGSFCFNKAAGTAGCTQWQMGIGNPAGYNSGTPTTTLKKVLLNQVNAIGLYRGVHWTAPFDYLPGLFYASAPPFVPNPPAGVSPLAGLVLFEGTSTGNQFFNSGTEQVLQPQSAVGCNTVVTTTNQGANGYDC